MIRATWGMERRQTSIVGKWQVPTGISQKHIRMPTATKLSQEYKEKVVSLRSKKPAKGIPNRSGIGTSRLYKIIRLRRNLLSSGGAGGLPARAILFGQFVRKNRQNARKVERFAKQVDVLHEIQESYFEDMEDLDEAVEGASRHHRKHQQRLFGRHRKK